MDVDQQKHQRFAELFVRNEAAVYRYIVSLIPNRADADEVFQQTNLTLWTIWDRYDPDREFLPWAFGIARNESRNFIRPRRSRHCELTDDVIAELTERRLREQEHLVEQQEALNDCLEKLPSRQRDLIHLCYGSEASMKVVAKQRGQSPDALYKALQRIRDLLHDCVQRNLVLASRS
ncbi:sigma-70 family RNA polymerase sigma factor [Blastopirellula marina]|uniref:sigma-70 family RNA polymerase sigma factor n=1 Tax=Blastopirellula marina TaxID=124 RepID=UPI00030632CC|nr:sigma-70 family RNA polymerase sigma factor [Blastopirellula marina]